MAEMRSRFPLVGLLLAGVFFFGLGGLEGPQEPSGNEGHRGHEAMSMPDSGGSMTPAMEAKLLADKKESEFNHHLAGFLVALGGVFMFFQGGLAGKSPALKYLWPACF